MLVKELQLLVSNLYSVVESDVKFFASIKFIVKTLFEYDFTNMNQEKIKEMKLLTGKIEEFFKQYRPTGSEFYITPNQISNNDSSVKRINEIVSILMEMSEQELHSELSDISKEKKALESNPRQNYVFIGHGHNKLWARVKMYLEDELSLKAIMYESESQTSKSVVSILEGFLDAATFAVIVLTAEDKTTEGNTRARQNVIHEIGLFQGRIGFNKVVLLIQDGIEEFSNIAGLQYIPFSNDKIEQTFYELHRVLKREGLLP